MECIRCGCKLGLGDNQERCLCHTCETVLDYIENMKTNTNVVIPIKGFLFVEDGSIDVDSLEENIQGSGIEIVIYRQGAPMPKLVLIDKEE